MIGKPSKMLKLKEQMEPGGASERGPQAAEMQAGGRLTQTQSTKMPPQNELHWKIGA